MSYTVTEQEIRIVGGMAFLFALYSIWMGQMTALGLPDGYQNPVLALELVKDGADIDKIMVAKSASGKSARDFIIKSTHKDFGYIVVYVFFFICLSLLLTRTNVSWARWAGWAAATCAFLGGVLDLIEDRGMLAATRLGSAKGTDALANSIRYPSLGKWTMLYIFCLLMGLLLISRQDRFAVPALFFLLACALGLTGVISNLLKPKFYWMFPASILLMGLAVLCVAIAFTVWPLKLSEKFLPITP